MRMRLLVLLALLACDDGGSDDCPACGADGATVDGARLDEGGTDARIPDGQVADGEAVDGSHRDAELVDRVPDSGELPRDLGDRTCAEAWSMPRLEVTAISRPAGSPGLQLRFDYGLAGGAHIVLTTVEPAGRAQPSDGPFSVETHSGAWVELQSEAGAVLYTRQVFELIGESLEAPPPPGDGGFVRVDRCPDAGFIRLNNMANDPAATQVVLFQEAIDGMSGGPTRELARFRLP